MSKQQGEELLTKVTSMEYGRQYFQPAFMVTGVLSTLGD